ILASNAHRNLDAALHRRLGVSVEIPPPGAAERRVIWDKLLPAPTQRSPEIDLDILARVEHLTGGDIRNAVVAAVLIAARYQETMDMRHLAVAIWRELTKTGRIVDGAELGAWQATIRQYVDAGRR